MCAVRLNAPLLASAAALTFGAALAANAGGYVPPVVEPVVVEPVVAAPVGDWQGGYAGLTLGYAFGGDDEVGLNGTNVDTLEVSGVNAGVRVGYRWQRDRWVFGPELGFEGGNIDDSFSTDGYDAESKIKNVLALRLKTGYALDNGMLVYGTIGAARAKVDYSIGGTDIDDTYTKSGYIVGLGVEKMLTERMSVTGEYEYANFGKEDLSAGGVSTEATADYHNVKLGLNFKF